jgi:hypothetical protein
MKLIKTISKLVTESQKQYEEACDRGVPEKELEKQYRESLKLMRLYEDTKKNLTDKKD